MESASGASAAHVLDPANQRLLNTYIYDYLLKQSYGDTARRFKEEGGVALLSAKEAENRKEAGPHAEGSLTAQLDHAARADSEKKNGTAGRHSPKDTGGPAGELPPADVPVNVEGGFLAEWWVIFWDMFSARQGRPSTANATTFMAHNQRLKQERQAATANAMMGSTGAPLGDHVNTSVNPNAMRLNLPTNSLTASNVDAAAAAAASAAGLDPNGPNAQLNNKTREALMRQAMMNNGNKGRNFPPTAAQIQQLKTQQYLQQQAQREDSEGVPGQGINPQSPASMSAPSPSKRQRLSPDGAYAQIPNNQRPQPGMPMNQQATQAHQMLMQAGINPAGLSPQQLAAFQSQTPVMQQKQLSAYVQGLASQQQRAMQQATKGQMPQSNMVSASPTMANAEGAPAEGNHALQDYQMQLMLLEQQNKKRLLMARQEQERLQQPSDAASAPNFNNSPPGGRPAGSPAPGSIDLPRGTPKMGNQNVPGTPGEQQPQRPGQQHALQHQQQQIQRNASPAVGGFVPQHGSQDPQQQMMYRQMMQQQQQAQQQQQQENGAMPVIMGPNGQMIRVPPQMAGLPPNHPAFQNPQMMQQMMAANGDPRARENFLWQQQQQQQQRQLMQQMHQNGQIARGQLTPQQQHSLAQHHAAQQAQQAQQQPQGMPGLAGQHQMPPPQGPLPMQQAGPGANVPRSGSTNPNAQPPSPSLSNQNPATPVQSNAKVPPARKASGAGKETKKQTAAKARKAAAAAAAAAAASGSNTSGGPPAGAQEPATPTTPITPQALNLQQQQLQQAQQAQQQVGQQQFAHPGQQGDGNAHTGSFMEAGQDGGVGNAPGSGGPAAGGFDAAFSGELNMDLMQDFDFESFLADDPNSAGGAMNFGFNGDDGE